MNTNKITELINKGFQEGDFTGNVDTNKIKEIEKMLKVTFPESYKWFVKKFGHGGIGGVEILGVSKAGVPTCVTETERFRTLGLPLSYVVIENCDEWLYCLDTSKLKDGECPVTDWDRRGNTSVRYKSFEDYLLDRLDVALERIGRQ